MPPEVAAQFKRIGIEQELVRVEAMACFRRVRAMYAVAVELAWAHIGQIPVPHLVGVFRQRDTIQFSSPRWLEET